MAAMNVLTEEQKLIVKVYRWAWFNGHTSVIKMLIGYLSKNKIDTNQEPEENS